MFIKMSTSRVRLLIVCTHACRHVHVFVFVCFTRNFDPLVQLDSIQFQIVTKQPKRLPTAGWLVDWRSDMRVSALFYFSRFSWFGHCHFLHLMAPCHRCPPSFHSLKQLLQARVTQTSKKLFMYTQQQHQRGESAFYLKWNPVRTA